MSNPGFENNPNFGSLNSFSFILSDFHIKKETELFYYSMNVLYLTHFCDFAWIFPSTCNVHQLFIALVPLAVKLK